MKVSLTESCQGRSGYMHIDKQVTLSILVMLFSLRGTKTAEVEGLWLANGPECLVPEYPDNSPHDVMIVCSDLPAEKPLHMCIRTAMVHLCICRHPCWNLKCYKSSEPLHLFLNPIVMPVTYISIYIIIINDTHTNNSHRIKLNLYYTTSQAVRHKWYFVMLISWR